jgi:hypothetical protein
VQALSKNWLFEIWNKMKKDSQISENGGKDIAGIALPYHVPYQRTMYPVDIVTEHLDGGRLGGTQSAFVGLGSNNKYYAVKKITNGNEAITASEFFCHELAALVNIPTPDWNIVRLKNCELAFGSVWEYSESISDPMLILNFLENKFQIKNLVMQLSKIYAFDMFVNNTDRHFGNYLLRKSFSNSHVLYAYDFGLSWWMRKHFDGDEVFDGCNTQVNFKLIKGMAGFKVKESLSVLDNIEKINTKDIEKIVKAIPDEWLSESQKNEVIEWWGSSRFFNRLNRIRKEINSHALD